MRDVSKPQHTLKEAQESVEAVLGREETLSFGR